MNRAPILPGPFGNQIEDALERLYSSPEFASSEQLRRLLAFLVKRTLEGRRDELKETVIGVEVFGRDPGYDPKLDGVVRTEARRLRFKLAEYYEGTGREDRLVVALPKGGYVPAFHERNAPAADPSELTKPETTSAPRLRPRWRYAYWIAAIGAVAAILGISISRARLSAPVARVPRLLNTGLPITRMPTFSPDGRYLMVSVDGGGQSHIWIHDLKSQSNRQVTSGDVRDYMPCWSPDGRRVGFLRRSTMEKSELMVLELDTGKSRTVGTVARVLPIEWSRDGRFLVVSDQTLRGGPLAIFLINAETGTRRQITSPPPGMVDSEPRFSGSGRKIAFVRTLGDSVNDLYLVPLKDSLDPDSQPVRLTSDKQNVKGFAWSADDRSVIASMKRGRLTRSLWRIPLDGGPPEHLPESGIEPLTPAISPQTSQLAYVNLIEDTNIWSLGNEASPLIESNRGDSAPQISPDNRWIVFRSTRSGTDGIWLARRDGSGPRQLTDCGGTVCGGARWAPDSKRIALDSRQAGSADIFITSIDQPNPSRFTSEPGNEVVPSWSRDGKSIYFASNRSGAWQVLRKPLAGGETEQITRDGGFATSEDAEGRYLYFSKQVGGRGLWRIPLNGGSEEPLVPGLNAAMWGAWALVPSGIYFIDYDPVTAGGPGEIEFYDLATRTRRVIAKTVRMPVMWDLSLAAAPDRPEVLYTQLDRAGTDLFLIDHFR